MKRVYRFMILALVGFTIGAGVAFLQQWREAQREPVAIVAGAEEQVVTDVPTAVAVESAAEVAMNEAAVDVTGDGVTAGEVAAGEAAVEDMAAHQHDAHDVAGHAGHDMAEHDHAKKEATAIDAAAVVGSSVGGSFELTDHNGQSVTDKSWPDKYTLVFFGFTHCPDICPAALDKMTATLNTLGDNAGKLQPLFITIDPARDDVTTMKAYLDNYHPAILGLTGTEAQIKQAEDGYKVYAAKVEGADPVNYTMAHSSYIFLMSPQGELLEIFRDADPADTLAARIRDRLSQ